MNRDILSYKISRLLDESPWMADFFHTNSIDPVAHGSDSFIELSEALDEEFYRNTGTDKEQFRDDFLLFIEQMRSLQNDRWNIIERLSVLAGRDKDGNPEKFSLELVKGEITAIVGPTGSGKSRLLEDIECLAQGDTPTGRSIRINGNIPDEDLRFSSDRNLVAQLSQNMNFVMDLSVEDFLGMHCESRMVSNVTETVERIFRAANELASEKTALNSATAHSGGQSRSP
jgi:ABC-type iron transport system FetAB ATPase subunit